MIDAVRAMRRLRDFLIFVRKRTCAPPRVQLEVTLDREIDGRWIAAIEALPGVLAYGRTRQEAIANVWALALHVIADDVTDRVDTPDDPASPPPAISYHVSS